MATAAVEPHSHQQPRNGMLRARLPGQHTPVTTFELFFDLVFVFAVTQLSHTLATHLDTEGAVHTLVLMLAVWWAWVYTTWATNWCDPNHLVVRLLLVAIMLAGLIMSAAIPEAFEGRGLVFAVAFAGIQVFRSSFVIWATRHDPVLKRNFVRITIWMAASGVFWIAGGIAEGDSRLRLWTAALAIEYLGPPMAFLVPLLGRSSTSDWTVEGSHMAERCGLFMIIALGESLLVTGATFSGLEWTDATVAAMLASFGAAVGMWWIYFDRSAEAGSELIGHSNDPGRLARLAYTYIHLPMVAGIVLTAVGDERVLAHPTGDTEFRVALVILGGPALFLLGHWLFKRALFEHYVAAHIIGIAALGVGLAAYQSLSAVVLTTFATIVIVSVAAWTRLAHIGDQTTELAG